MNLSQIRKASKLLKDRINSANTIVLDSGGLALQVYFEDSSQKVFKDIESVIDWLQVQHLKDKIPHAQ